MTQYVFCRSRHCPGYQPGCSSNVQQTGLVCTVYNIALGINRSAHKVYSTTRLHLAAHNITLGISQGVDPLYAGDLRPARFSGVVASKLLEMLQLHAIRSLRTLWRQRRWLVCCCVVLRLHTRAAVLLYSRGCTTWLIRTFATPRIGYMACCEYPRLFSMASRPLGADDAGRFVVCVARGCIRVLCCWGTAVAVAHVSATRSALQSRLHSLFRVLAAGCHHGRPLGDNDAGRSRSRCLRLSRGLCFLGAPQNISSLSLAHPQLYL